MDEKEQKKRMEEMQKAQFEEQKKARKMQLDMTLKQLQVNRKLVECTIERMKAEGQVMENVEMKEEKNDFKKKALEAKHAETLAMIDNEKLKLEMIDLNEENVKFQLKNIDRMPMMPPMR